MKKSKKKIKKPFLPLYIFALLLMTGNILLFGENLKIEKILTQKPVDIQVVNITTSDAWIYWKAPQEGLQSLFYKEEKGESIFEKVHNVSISKDVIEKKWVYYVHLKDLESDTKYKFQIVSEDWTWEVEDTFSTKLISEEIQFPQTVTGDESNMSFILVDVSGDKLMIDT